MEIVLDNINYRNKLFNINMCFENSKIYSILGNTLSNKEYISKILINSIKNYKGSIYGLNNIKVSYMPRNPYDSFNSSTAKKDIIKLLDEYKYSLDRLDYLTDLISIDKNILDKNIDELNTGEIKKLSLLKALIINPKVLIIEDYTLGINRNDINDFERIIRLLKNRYNKIIILITKDTDFAYKVSDYNYILSYGKIVLEGNNEILKKNIITSYDLSIPLIADFINKYNNSGRGLYNYNNILDLIKGIYRDIH